MTILSSSGKPKREKASTFAKNIGEMDGARRQMDEMMIEIWEDRFRFQSKQIEELTQTVRGVNGTPGVMERLGKIETNQVNQGQMLTNLGEAVDGIRELLTRAPKAAEEPEKRGLTKDQLAAMALGFMKPVITAVVIWALLTFFPELLVHLGTP